MPAQGNALGFGFDWYCALKGRRDPPPFQG